MWRGRVVRERAEENDWVIERRRGGGWSAKGSCISLVRIVETA